MQNIQKEANILISGTIDSPLIHLDKNHDSPPTITENKEKKTYLYFFIILKGIIPLL